MRAHCCAGELVRYARLGFFEAVLCEPFRQLFVSDFGALEFRVTVTVRITIDRMIRFPGD